MLFFTFPGSNPGWKPIPTTFSTLCVCGRNPQTSLRNIIVKVIGHYYSDIESKKKKASKMNLKMV